MIRMLLADDQNMLRGAMATMLDLEEDFVVTNQAANGEEVLQALETQIFDLLILDIEMPKYDGLEVVKLMRQNSREEKVLMLTTFSTAAYVKEAMKMKVEGYLLKDTPSEQLAHAVRDIVYHGRTVISPEITYQFVQGDDNPLTEREKEILHLAERGFSTKQIAAELFLSSGTIRNYFSELLDKLGAQNRSQAVYIAKEKEYI
ncbi:response regulator transcription factor [Terribacillus saccharophilus]|uniref:Two component transcriptional regulator, LuxR family n=1 Tax=Terribacillus saccharophilus TaxID=361277 RepID=A0AAX2EDD5_9BACI|nr:MULTISPECIES: response regulator transcription factor [Terribacillus]MCM3225099.1 response regulator transcription factor [Terribacillus saccharophilus]MEC0282980.1 response regulator transcription factor [Terribacillus saccharophilus]MEC0289937.1 response regulator transcription factor [Terribacillus saccharophilus]SEM80616.1 two component transcriptional regulator, LuxR family [Terribacillus saccharophilus]